MSPLLVIAAAVGICAAAMLTFALSCDVARLVRHRRDQRTRDSEPDWSWGGMQGGAVHGPGMQHD